MGGLNVDAMLVGIQFQVSSIVHNVVQNALHAAVDQHV